MSGRLLFDVTKASKQSHYSGVLRVSHCLKTELKNALGEDLVEVVWSERKQTFKAPYLGRGFSVEADDVLLTAELFNDFERPGIEAFLRSSTCRAYAIFHDAIPLRHPEFTWPHSVQRHPSYMKMLSLFDGVFGVSQHSSIVLEEYWEWLGYEYSPSVKSIQLGADGLFKEPLKPEGSGGDGFDVLMLGIIEKRKGQDFALDACSRLWDDGLEFNLHIVGRANPYFGKDIERRIKRMIKAGRPITLHGHLEDEMLKSLIPAMDLLLFASRSEGCGLPVLESLWSGLPVLSAKLMPVRETSRFGGVAFFNREDSEDLAVQLRRLVENRNLVEDLKNGIQSSMLPTWEMTAKEVLDTIKPRIPIAV
ncbi:glycosyltransferase [Pelagicoccus sp. SDUM812002]|uniref:glycosyltransferase n=1 Tax=Pelagicoccus sp. SDUM812002 TaxID=3041266 RepID=UPI00280F9A39|nr:glycosyltransferase [Pelagicoccus sp. SDUM812002]MDQ8184560.1 glycosyltransferase [Pelagicoccus sp. SDUM812002]